MTAERDPYSVLEVAPGSSDEVIQAARKALLLKYHPDRFRGDPKEAARRSAEINTAYEVVGNPKRRAKYDEESGVLDAEIEEAPDWREPPPPPPPRNDRQQRDPPPDPPDAGDGVEVWKRSGSSGGWVVPATGLGIVLAIVLFASGVLSPHRQLEPAPSNDTMASATSPTYLSNDLGGPGSNAMATSASAVAPEAATNPAGRLNSAQLAAYQSDTSAALSYAEAGRCWDADKRITNAANSYELNGWYDLERRSRDAQLVNYIAGLWQEYRTAWDALIACGHRQSASGRSHYTGDFSQGLVSIIAAADKGDCTTANATLTLMTQSVNNAPEFYRTEEDGDLYSRAESAARLCQPASGQAEITVTGYRSQNATNDVQDLPAQPPVKTFTVQRAGPQ